MRLTTNDTAGCMDSLGDEDDRKQATAQEVKPEGGGSSVSGGNGQEDANKGGADEERGVAGMKNEESEEAMRATLDRREEEIEVKSGATGKHVGAKDTSVEEKDGGLPLEAPPRLKEEGVPIPSLSPHPKQSPPKRKRARSPSMEDAEGKGSGSEKKEKAKAPLRGAVGGKDRLRALHAAVTREVETLPSSPSSSSSSPPSSSSSSPGPSPAPCVKQLPGPTEGCRRQRAILKGLDYLYKLAIKRANFVSFGADVIMTLMDVASQAADDRVRKSALQVGREDGEKRREGGKEGVAGGGDGRRKELLHEDEALCGNRSPLIKTFFL